VVEIAALIAPLPVMSWHIELSEVQCMEGRNDDGLERVILCASRLKPGMDSQILASEGLELIRNIFGAILVLFENGFGRVRRTARESRRRSRRSAKIQLSSFLEDMVQELRSSRRSSLLSGLPFTCVLKSTKRLKNRNEYS